MIGKEIRSFKQLVRECGNSLRSALINFRMYGYSYCRVMVVNELNVNSKKEPNAYLLIFNNRYNFGDFRIKDIISSPCFDGNRDELIGSFRRLMSISLTSLSSPNELYTVINGIFLLPESFEDDYNAFLKNNSKTVRQLIGKYGFSENNTLVKEVFVITGDSKNFFIWAINAIFGCGVAFNSIKRILWWCENYGQLVKKLSKGTVTAYTTYNDVCSLFDECRMLRNEKRVNSVINTFNTAQKKALREAVLTEDDKNVLSAFYRLSENKKRNFIQKMSSITDSSEIMHHMRHVTSAHFSWNKDSFIDFITNADGITCEKIYDNGDIVLIKVSDFDSIKNIAKTTNWCISKNKTYWNNYVGTIRGAEQYVLLDFSQKEDSLTSIVGFTSKYNNGITNAHDFANNDILNIPNMPVSTFINSYISHLKGNNSIYSLLEKDGIDVTLVAKYEKPLYAWDKESMYKYLYECVDRDNVQILMDKNELVVLSVKDWNIKYFIGDSYIDNIDETFYSYKHIIFMDFSINQYNPNRIIFGIIEEGMNGNDDRVVAFKNEHCVDCTMSFNDKLAQFGLPYNTIKRFDDKFMKLRDAIRLYNVPELAKAIENPEFLSETIMHVIGPEGMTEYIKSSIVELVSFDYINVFYNSNHRISEFIGYDYTSSIIEYLLDVFISGHQNRNCSMPKQHDIERFFNKETTNINEALTICVFLAIDKILSKEVIDVKANEWMYKKIMDTIILSRCKGTAIDHFIEIMLDNFDISSENKCIRKIFEYTMSCGGKKLKEKLESLQIKSPYLRQVFGTPSICDASTSLYEEEEKAEVMFEWRDLPGDFINHPMPDNIEAPIWVNAQNE